MLGWFVGWGGLIQPAGWFGSMRCWSGGVRRTHKAPVVFECSACLAWSSALGPGWLVRLITSLTYLT